jgi:hypothetical protein
MIQGAFVMPAKAAATRVTAKVAAKSVRANGAKPRAKKARMSKLEAKRLESFKALMAKYARKCSFASFPGPQKQGTGGTLKFIGSLSTSEAPGIFLREMPLGIEVSVRSRIETAVVEKRNGRSQRRFH